jgi:two-component system CheB/CheR fusion protein
MELHEGKIWAESEGPQQGSVFHLSLPLAEGEPPESSVVPVPEARQANKALRVLFVEDSADVLNLFRIELTARGYHVLAATNAEEGLELAKRQLPDVVVSDIKMPGVDGYEFMQRLRQMPKLAEVPAIALTGFGREKDVETALAAGYDAHICKPVEIEHLTHLINSLVATRD